MTSKNDPIGPRQQPISRPVLGMNEPEAVRAAVRQPCGVCGGQLWLTPPTLTSGYVSCLSCSAETHTVLEMVRPVVKFEDIPWPKPGRPKKVGVAS